MVEGGAGLQPCVYAAGITPALAAEVLMAIPYRGSTGVGTYFITTSTHNKEHLLQSERMSSLLIRVLYGYRDQGKFLLHAFAVMPNHLHLLLTPLKPVTLERAVQYIKGGFSFRVKKEHGFAGEIWQTRFL
jgi:putative transposase